MPLPLQRYWDLAAAPVETAALDAALELDLFAHLLAPASAAQIAQALALRPAASEHLLDMLWSLRLLPHRRRAAALPLRRHRARPFRGGTAPLLRRRLALPAPLAGAVRRAVGATVAPGSRRRTGHPGRPGRGRRIGTRGARADRPGATRPGRGGGARGGRLRARRRRGPPHP
ncbi:methyltransferase dimerization domain-containing protein [Achromobacter insuavis]